MKLSDYLELSREVRTSHVVLSTPCLLTGKVSTRHRRARKALLELLGVDDNCPNWQTAKVYICHLCPHDSTKGYCENPLHTYFGTPAENSYDLPEEGRKAKATNGAKAAGESRSKPVELTRVEDGEVFIFPSVSQAARALRTRPDNVGRVCRGERNKHKGHTARFVD